MNKIRLGVDHPAVEIRIDDPVEAERVAALFPSYVSGEEGSEPLALISVQTDPGREGGTVQYGDTTVRCESRSDLISTVEFEATLALLAHLPRYAQLHASGAVVDGGAVLAMGPSGSGKSNLAMAWHRAGHRLLGDDAVLLTKDGGARAFARLMKLDLDRAQVYRIDLERTLTFDPTAREIWYDPCEGAGWETEVRPVRVVAWVRWRPGSALQVRRLDRAEGLNRMIGDLFGSGLTPAEAVPVLAQVASEAELPEVEFEDSVDAAAHIARRVSASGSGAER